MSVLNIPEKVKVRFFGKKRFPRTVEIKCRDEG